MEIDIIKQDVPFLLIPKQVLTDKNLSVESKGFYAMIYAVLPNRTFTLEELGITTGLKDVAVMCILQELTTAGYMRISKDGKIYFNRI